MTILEDEYIVPSLSVFHCSRGYWRRRQKSWKEYLIKSSFGFPTTDVKEVAYSGESSGNCIGKEINKGYSTFDPVLTEIMYRWFCPEKGKILDPFAGSSMRGLITGILDYKYTGIEIRGEQVEANYKDSKLYNLDTVEWIHGDSKDKLKDLDNNTFDFVFTSPSYYGIEIYSLDSDDISSHGSYSRFKRDYNKIISYLYSKLRENRFACFVVGEGRNRKGVYSNQVGHTIDAFIDSGFCYYNKMILEKIGTVESRVQTFFPNYRKVGKTHQNVLLFFKGDVDKIPDVFPAKINSETPFLRATNQQMRFEK